MQSNKDSYWHEDLGKQGNSLAEEHIKEKPTLTIKGDFGQALVVTEKAIYILKWGYRTGLTFGGRCTAYHYHNITSVQFQKKLTSRFIEVITPGNQDKSLSYWTGRGKEGNAIQAPNAVTFAGKNYEKFKGAVTYVQDKLSSQHSAQGVGKIGVSVAEQLEKLALLKKQGHITQKEFDAEKTKLLKG